MFRLYNRVLFYGLGTKKLENQVKNQSATPVVCIWGIEKFFDPKQCLKFFNKNFGNQHVLTHLLKQKNKPFFLVKFAQPIIPQEFNKQHATSKRAKVKTLQEGMNFAEEEFIPIEEVAKPAEKKEVKASEEDWLKVRNSKIQDVVAPLHNLPYEEQVAQKVKDINRVIENYNRQYFRDAEVTKKIKEGQQLKQLALDEFIPCETRREGYRTKSQMTIGYNIDGEITIGFNKGSYHNQTITIESPKNVNIISKNTKFVIALLEHFIKTNHKELSPYDRIKQVGFWRYVIVRESSRTQQTLVMVVAKTEGVEAEVVAKVKEELVDFMKKSVRGLAGMCFLPYNGQADSVPSDKPELIYGNPFYNQIIFGRTFRVSPGAFLQIHMDMCQVLYSRIIQSVKQCDVVLDLGCGIGTIGISIQDKLPNVKVIGVQINEQAVEDARKNSQNYQVELGRAEDLIKGICDKYRGNKIVAVLDPPRAGFNKEVMVALRRCRGLDNIIYVACNAGSIQDNLLQLTLPMTDKRKAPQFLVKSMRGFDLFPQTSHYEVLYVLQRKE